MVEALSFFINTLYYYYFSFFYAQNHQFIFDFILSLGTIFVMFFAFYVIIFIRYYKVYFINSLAVSGRADGWLNEFYSVINVYNVQARKYNSNVVDPVFARNFLIHSIFILFAIFEYGALLLIIGLTLFFFLFKPVIEIPGVWRYRLWLKPLFFFARDDFVFKDDVNSVVQFYPSSIVHPYPESYPEAFIRNFSIHDSILFNPSVKVSHSPNTISFLKKVWPWLLRRAETKKHPVPSLHDVPSLESEAFKGRYSWLILLRSNSLMFFKWFKKDRSTGDEMNLNRLDFMFKTYPGSRHTVTTFRPESADAGLQWSNPKVNLYPSTFFTKNRYRTSATAWKYIPEGLSTYEYGKSSSLKGSTKAKARRRKSLFDHGNIGGSVNNVSGGASSFNDFRSKKGPEVEQSDFSLDFKHKFVPIKEKPRKTVRILDLIRGRYPRDGNDLSSFEAGFYSKFFGTSRSNLTSLRTRAYSKGHPKLYRAFNRNRARAVKKVRRRLRSILSKVIERHFKNMGVDDEMARLEHLIHKYNDDDWSVTNDPDFMALFENMIEESNKAAQEYLDKTKSYDLETLVEPEFLNSYKAKAFAALNEAMKNAAKDAASSDSPLAPKPTLDSKFMSVKRSRLKKKVKKRKYKGGKVNRYIRFRDIIKDSRRMNPLSRTDTRLFTLPLEEQNSFQEPTWLWETWSSRSIYDIIRQYFFIKFRHGLGEYRLYKRRLSHYFTNRIYDSNSSMFREFPHYKRRFMLRDWSQSNRRFQRSDVDLNDIKKVTDVYKDIVEESVLDGCESFTKPTIEPNGDRLDSLQVLVRMFRDCISISGKKMNRRLRFSPSLVENPDWVPPDSEESEGEKIDDKRLPKYLRLAEPPVPDQASLWKEKGDRGYRIFRHRLVQRLAFPSRYLDPKYKKRAKALFMFWRSMNKHHFDYTLNSHRWKSSQGFSWPFARFMIDRPHIVESSDWKKVGLVSRYKKFHFSLDPLLFNLHERTAHRDPSRFGFWTRAMLFQFTNPTWISYFNGQDIIESRRTRMPISEQFNNFFQDSKNPYNIVSNFVFKGEPDKEASLSSFDSHNGPTPPVFESDVIIRNSGDTFLRRFYKALLWLRFIRNSKPTAEEEDSLLFKDLRDLLLLDMEKLYSEGTDKEQGVDYGDEMFSGADKFLDFFLPVSYYGNMCSYLNLDLYSVRSLLFSRNASDFTDELDHVFAGLYCSNISVPDYRSQYRDEHNKLNSDLFWDKWFTDLHTNSDLGSAVSDTFGEYSTDSGVVEFDSFDKFARDAPNPLGFDLFKSAPLLNNRLSAYFSGAMSNFVFDSYKGSTIPVTYLDRPLISRWHRHRSLPSELSFSGNTNPRLPYGLPIPYLRIKYRRSFKNVSNIEDYVYPRTAHELKLSSARWFGNKRKKLPWYKRLGFGRYYLNLSYNNIRKSDFSIIANEELDDKLDQLNNYFLRPYDVPYGRIPDISKLGEASMFDDGYFFDVLSSDLTNGYKFKEVSDYPPFDLPDRIKEGNEIDERERWDYPILPESHDEAWAITNNTEHIFLSKTEQDLFNERARVWRPRWFYIVPTQFRSLVYSLNNYEVSFYPDLFKMLDLYGKMIRSPHVPSRGSVLVNEFLNSVFSDLGSDEVCQDRLIFFRDFQDLFDDSYLSYTNRLEDYLDFEDRFKEFNFNTFFDLVPQLNLGKYNQGYAFFALPWQFKKKYKNHKNYKVERKQERRRNKGRRAQRYKSLLYLYKRARKSGKRLNALRKLWYGAVHVNDMELTEIDPTFDVVVERIKSLPSYKKAFTDYPLKFKVLSNPEFLVSRDKRRLFRAFRTKLRPKIIQYKAVDEVSYINIFYSFVHMVRKVIRFFIINAIEFIPNFDSILIVWYKSLKIFKFWFDSWLGIFGTLLLALGFIYMSYRSKGGLVPAEYKAYSSYLLEFRPELYFSKVRGWIKKWVFRSFSVDLSEHVSNHLPFVGSHQNSRFYDFYYSKFMAFNLKASQLAVQPPYKAFRILFPNIVEAWDQGVTDLYFKVQEMKLLYKDKRSKSRNLKSKESIKKK